MFVYCENNPVRNADPSGELSEEDADKLICYLAPFIKAAGLEFGVDPAIIACCIYTEQVQNVNWLDSFDGLLYFFDTSIGVGQVRVSTARMLEDNGYMPKTESYMFAGMFITDVIVNVRTRNMEIASKLSDAKTNIRYVAAYLRYWQDKWESVYDLAGEADILWTLYNLGENANSPNTSPKANPFGTYAGQKYNHIAELLQ